jgi:hypothetical protein
VARRFVDGALSPSRSVGCWSLTNNIVVEQSSESTDQAAAMDGFSAAFRSSTTANIGRYMNSTIHRPTSM